jgi:DNA polymerase
MPAARTAADFLPATRDLPALREAAATCRGCPLYRGARQTVFGEGPPEAALLIVGEVPGAREDEAGRPFVGPAGALLDRGLAEAGLRREDAYVTNAVKHFKWKVRGGRQLAATPAAGEVNACRPWLLAEIEAVRPRLILCLGATAARALMGSDFRVTTQRGAVFETPWGPPLLATLHPAALLRRPDREVAYTAWLADLRHARALLEGDASAGPIRQVS